MPIHNTFFPEQPSINKSTNSTITIMKIPEEGPLIIKKGDTKSYFFEELNSNQQMNTFKGLPVCRAPLSTILHKKDSFFLLY